MACGAATVERLMSREKAGRTSKGKVTRDPKTWGWEQAGAAATDSKAKWRKVAGSKRRRRCGLKASSIVPGPANRARRSGSRAPSSVTWGRGSAHAQERRRDTPRPRGRRVRSRARRSRQVSLTHQLKQVKSAARFFLICQYRGDIQLRMQHRPRPGVAAPSRTDVARVSWTVSRHSCAVIQMFCL